MQFTCYQIIVHYNQIKHLEKMPASTIWRFSRTPSYNQMVHCSMFSHVNLSSCHVILQQSQVNPFRHLDEPLSSPVPARQRSNPIRATKTSYSPWHSSYHSSQAICFRNGESSNSLALGLFSWSISNVLLKNSWPSSLAFSGVVGFALEFPI